MPMRPALLVLLALVLCTLPAVIEAVNVGWACSGPEPLPNPDKDGVETRAFRILSGLRYWEHKTHKDRKANVLHTVYDAIDIGATYVDLCNNGSTYLVGPATYLETVEVVQALSGGSCPALALFASLHMDDSLKALLTSTNITYFTLVPDLPIYAPLTIPVIARLIKQNHYTWAILTAESNGTDPEVDRISLLGASLSTALSIPLQPGGFVYTVFQDETFNPSGPTAKTDVAAFIDTMSHRRPEASVFVLGVPTDDQAFVTLIDDVIFPTLNRPGPNKDKPNPDTAVLLSPVEFYDLPKETRKRLKYWTALALWDHSYHFKADSEKWSLGTSQKFWEHYEDRNDRRPGNWDALAAASALVLDRAEHDLGIENVKFKPFWGPVDFTNGSRQPSVDNWRTVQFLSGDTTSIGPDKADRKSISSPGRWKWKTYTLEGAAITAIVLAALLMLLGVAIFFFAVYKFIGLWLHPPSHSDTEKDDDAEGKEKSD